MKFLDGESKDVRENRCGRRHTTESIQAGFKQANRPDDSLKDTLIAALSETSNLEKAVPSAAGINHSGGDLTNTFLDGLTEEERRQARMLEGRQEMINVVDDFRRVAS